LWKNWEKTPQFFFNSVPSLKMDNCRIFKKRFLLFFSEKLKTSNRFFEENYFVAVDYFAPFPMKKQNSGEIFFINAKVFHME
jgi:hypothetical protein